MLMKPAPEPYVLLDGRVDGSLCENLIRRIDESLTEFTDYDKIRLRDLELWTVVKDVLADVNRFRDLVLSERWTCHRYGQGGLLKPHQDGTKFDSVYSVLVYLNDDFSGGRTDFLSKPDATFVTSSIEPVKGRIMVLEQNKWHMSTAIEDGVKYIARADLCLKKRQQVESLCTFKNFEIVI